MEALAEAEAEVEAAPCTSAAMAAVNRRAAAVNRSSAAAVRRPFVLVRSALSKGQ